MKGSYERKFWQVLEDLSSLFLTLSSGAVKERTI